MSASYSSSSLTRESLIACCADDLTARKITLKSGENTVRGAVLGRTATAGTIAGAAGSANTGNGTIGSLTVGGAAVEGVYKALSAAAATNSGIFFVHDPDGIYLGKATVGIAFSGAVNFTIADGSTDFALGDVFDITVSAVTYKYKLSLAAATDGSQIPDAILAEDTDASAADVVTVAYFAGEFLESGVTFGTGHTASSTRDELRGKDIRILSSITV